MGGTPLAVLAGALLRWHAQARKADAGTDPALNDPAPYARIRLAADAAGQPGPVLAEIFLTARHADCLASCVAGAFGGSASASPEALGQWLASAFSAAPGATVACWCEACDSAGAAQAQVSLDAAGATGLAVQLGEHAVWLAGEQVLADHSPFREGARVRVSGGAPHLNSARGRRGTGTRVQLATVDPVPDWVYSVRLYGDTSGFCQCFIASELAPASGEG